MNKHHFLKHIGIEDIAPLYGEERRIKKTIDTLFDEHDKGSITAEDFYKELGLLFNNIGSVWLQLAEQHARRAVLWRRILVIWIIAVVFLYFFIYALSIIRN